MNWHPVGPIVLSLVICAVIFGVPLLLALRAARASEAHRRRKAMLDRLRWVIGTDRGGGFWDFHGFTYRRYKPTFGGPVIEVEKGRYRWVRA